MNDKQDVPQIFDPDHYQRPYDIEERGNLDSLLRYLWQAAHDFREKNRFLLSAVDVILVMSFNL